jgi:hypothetical protein
MIDQSKHQKYVKNNIIMLVGRIVICIFIFAVTADGFLRHRYSLGPNRTIHLESSPGLFFLMFGCFVIFFFVFLYGVYQSARNLLQARRGNIDGEI